jgi:hypothetical protein
VFVCAWDDGAKVRVISAGESWSVREVKSALNDG